MIFFSSKSGKSYLIVIAIWLVVIACAYVTISYFNRQSLKLIQKIELFPSSDYAKAHLLYDEADIGFKKIMNEADKKNKNSDTKVLLSPDDELVTHTLGLYLKALDIDPVTEYSPQRCIYYERVAQIYEVCGEDYNRYEYMARALLCNENYKLAEMYAGTAAASKVKDRKAWELLANVYIGLKSWTYASVAVRQAQKAGMPDYTMLFYNAKIYFARENYQQAKESLMESLRMNPSQNKSRELMADTLEIMGESTASAHMLEDGIGHGIENSTALLYRMGMLFYKQNDLDKAIKYLSMALALAPDNPDLHWDLARALQHSGAPAHQVLEHQSIAGRINPNYKTKYLD
ncbi:MAG: tetratricopeptide repeat protein [Candidatus Sumerlaeales bacterium]|nr:tetratricopeptide repeat protein [Candidatus Sumerlaeales bacterium]